MIADGDGIAGPDGLIPQCQTAVACGPRVAADGNAAFAVCDVGRAGARPLPQRNRAFGVVGRRCAIAQGNRADSKGLAVAPDGRRARSVSIHSTGRTGYCRLAQRDGALGA